MRTLNAIVAEKVMGWDTILLLDWQLKMSKIEEEKRRFIYVDEEWEDLPHYSTDIAAAWMVVECMIESEYTATVFCSKGAEAVVNFYCPYGPCIRHGHDDITLGHGSDEISAVTAPLAICIAALRAVGVTQDEIDAAMKQEIAE